VGYAEVVLEHAFEALYLRSATYPPRPERINDFGDLSLFEDRFAEYEKLFTRAPRVRVETRVHAV
jgi:hypothetical protein